MAQAGVERLLPLAKTVRDTMRQCVSAGTCSFLSCLAVELELRFADTRPLCRDVGAPCSTVEVTATWLLYSTSSSFEAQPCDDREFV
jgi:hypothetical protein